MDGCVPDSIKYVPGLSAGVGVGQATPQHSEAGVPTSTSVENDCTRVPWTGGVPTPVKAARGASPAIGQVSGWALVWSGLATEVEVVPSPPPSWPTITSEVGMLPEANERRFVRLICRSCPVGTVITTGDQAPTPAAVGFSAAQTAVEPLTWVASQL